jgi:transcriptional regulator with XRE-family HTH domain
MTSQLPPLEPLHINEAEVIEAFHKYAGDTNDTPRQIAARIGVPSKTLRTWLEGQAQPTKRLTLRLAGFFKARGIPLNRRLCPSTASTE